MISSMSSASASSSYASSPAQDSARASTSPEVSGKEKSAAQQKADERTIAALAASDRKVRAHEAAHIAAAQGLAVSGASFTYTTGPDGKRYAVGGEVSIDASPANTPTETLLKAASIRRAALAPVDPSAQDRAVAAMADRMGADARLALSREQAAAYTRNEPNQTGALLDIAA